MIKVWKHYLSARIKVQFTFNASTRDMRGRCERGFDIAGHCVPRVMTGHMCALCVCGCMCVSVCERAVHGVYRQRGAGTPANCN